MKILHLIQKPQLRGAEMFASQLSEQLNKQGHEVTVVSIFAGKSELPFSGKQIHLKRGGNFRWLDFAGFKALAIVIRNEKPDILQANAGDTLKYAVLTKLLFQLPQPIIFRNASIVSLYIKNPLVKNLNAFLYNRTDAIASVSQQSKKDLNSLFPKTKPKTEVISIGIEGQPYSPVVPLGEPYLMHVGGFSFEKNHSGLLNIFWKVLKKYPAAHLSLIGDGPLRSEIERKANDLGINSHITFHGFLSNPMDYVAAADVFLLPSIIEGLPGVILEAFYCKTPVVAYNVGGVAEVVSHHITGKIISKNEEEGFVNAIDDLLENKENTTKITENAHQLVIREFRNEVIARKFADLYERVVAEAKK